MGAFMPKVVALGPYTPYSGFQDLSVMMPFYTDSATPYVRLWAYWPYLEPYPGVDPRTDASTTVLHNGDPWDGMTPNGYLQVLDRQILYAKQKGMGVILTFYGAPRWANGTGNLANDAYPEDRLNSQGVWKNMEWKPPDDVSTSSPWARMVVILGQRYSAFNPQNGGKVVDFLEVLNEPNLQWWPQRARSYVPSARSVTAAIMMKTAVEVLAYWAGGRPMVMGPALADTQVTDNLQTSALSFAADMHNTFGFINWRGTASTIWSHHNYGDVLDETTVRARDMARLLKIRAWSGWPGSYVEDMGFLMLTEGGATLPRVAARYGGTPQQVLQKHAGLVGSNWTGNRALAGVAAVAQYLFLTDPYYDSGLMDIMAVKRPAYAVWKSKPAYG